MTNFYLSNPSREKSTISISVHAFGWRLRRSLNISVLTKNWDKKKSRLKMIVGDYAKINAHLENWKAKANSLIIDYQINRIKPNLIEFESELFKNDRVENLVGFWSMFDNFIQAKSQMISKDGLKQYVSARNYLYEFMPRINSISDQMLSEITRKMLKEKYSPNTIAKRTSIYVAVSQFQGITLKKEIKITAKTPDKIYLDLSELARIREIKLKPYLNNARDIFIFSCFTGLRFSDIKKFNLSFVQEINNSKFIVYYSSKNGTKSVIPIFEPVQEILTKHKGLPRIISDQKYNIYLKEICELAGITQTIQLTKLEGERRTPFTIRKCDAVSSHTARRSFVTNMAKLGLNAKQIGAMSGHLTASIVEMYDKTSQEDNAVIVDGLLKGKI